MRWEPLHPILGYADERLAEVSRSPRDVPEQGSALAGDDRKLNGWHLSSLVISALNNAVEHVHAVKVLLVDAHVAHPHALLTLLRSALEDAALAAWLLEPDDRKERLTRALRAWRRDFADRAKYENHDRRPRSPRWKSGAERQAQMLAVGEERGLDSNAVKQPLYATSVIRDAASALGRREEALQLWGLSSGQAHGRLWATMMNTPTEVIPRGRTYTVSLVADHENVIRLARLDYDLIVRGEELLDLRGRRKRPSRP